MTILGNDFDFDALLKSRNKAKTSKDLVAGLRAIAPEIEELEVGQTCEIDVVGGRENLRKTVMGITAKLGNLTCKGGKWEGMSFKVASHPDNGKVYVQRGPKVKPEDIKERKRGAGGGRRKKTTEATTEVTEAQAKTAATKAVNKGAEIVVSTSGAVIKEHA